MSKKVISVLSLFFIFYFQSNAQQKLLVNQNNTQHSYYIYLSGIKTKEQVQALESSIQKKSGVLYFLGNRYPVRYFLLKTSQEVSKGSFLGWIGNKYMVDYFEEGEDKCEGALLQFYKTHRAVKK